MKSSKSAIPRISAHKEALLNVNPGFVACRANVISFLPHVIRTKFYCRNLMTSVTFAYHVNRVLTNVTLS